MKRSHVVNVGATPGLTRSLQEVQLDKNVKLLDCPGVVMLRSGENDASIALRNCKRIEKLDDPIGPGKKLSLHDFGFCLCFEGAKKKKNVDGCCSLVLYFLFPPTPGGDFVCN